MRSRANGRLRLRFRKTIPDLTPGKIYRLRIRGCEVVQTWDGSDSWSISKKYTGSGSGSEQNVTVAPAPDKMWRLRLRVPVPNTFSFVHAFFKLYAFYSTLNCAAELKSILFGKFISFTTRALEKIIRHSSHFWEYLMFPAPSEWSNTVAWDFLYLKKWWWWFVF